MMHSDHQLEQAQQFQIHALTEIYQEFSPALYRYALSRLGNPAYAEDCVADTFQRFLQSLQKKHPNIDNLRAYLYRIAHNWIIDHYRSKAQGADELMENAALPNQKSLESARSCPPSSSKSLFSAIWRNGRSKMWPPPSGAVWGLSNNCSAGQKSN